MKLNRKQKDETTSVSPAIRKADVGGSSSVKKFRRGKKFQQAYFEIGGANQKIANLLIEAETFERYNNNKEAKSRRELAAKFKEEIVEKYDAETFDLNYTIPQTSGLYRKQSRRDVL